MSIRDSEFLYRYEDENNEVVFRFNYPDELIFYLDSLGLEVSFDCIQMLHQPYMNPATGFVDTYDGWTYLGSDGEFHSAVDDCSVFPVLLAFDEADRLHYELMI